MLAEAKLAPARMVCAPFSFNVGVELGNFTLRALVTLRGALLRYEPSLSVGVVGITNAAIGFVSRIWH